MAYGPVQQRSEIDHHSDKALRARKRSRRRKTRYFAAETYWPNACSIIDNEDKIHRVAEPRTKLRTLSIESESILSAIEGDFTEIILSDAPEEAVKDELY